jgi:hypothetical protein
MRIALGVLMLLHGIAHLPGFLGSWRLATLEGMPYKTTILSGRLDLGDAGIRVVGAAWLVVALGFGLAAVAALAGRAWWWPAALGVALASLCLSGLEWPEARIGVAVNLAILAALLASQRLGWTGVTA